MMKSAADHLAELVPFDLEIGGIGGLLRMDGIDKRCRAYRRYRAIQSAVMSDAGGETNVSEVQRQLISKFCTLAVLLEALEAAAIQGTRIDIDLFGRCAGHLRRIAETIGLRRIPRDVTPTLDQIVREIEAEREAKREEAVG